MEVECSTQPFVPPYARDVKFKFQGSTGPGLASAEPGEARRQCWIFPLGFALVSNRVRRGSGSGVMGKAHEANILRRCIGVWVLGKLEQLETSVIPFMAALHEFLHSRV